MSSFDRLENIAPTEAPEFLYTRIQAKIERITHNKLPKMRAFALLCGLFLLFVVNIAFVRSQKSNPQNGIAEAYSLMPHNDLYHE